MDCWRISIHSIYFLQARQHQMGFSERGYIKDCKGLKSTSETWCDDEDVASSQNVAAGKQIYVFQNVYIIGSNRVVVCSTMR